MNPSLNNMRLHLISAIIGAITGVLILGFSINQIYNERTVLASQSGQQITGKDKSKARAKLADSQELTRYSNQSSQEMIEKDKITTDSKESLKPQGGPTLGSLQNSENLQTNSSEIVSSPKPPDIAVSAAVKMIDPERSLLRLKDYIKDIEEQNGFLKEKLGLLNNLLEMKEKEITRLNQDNTNLNESLNKSIAAQNTLKEEFNKMIDGLKVQITQKDYEISGLATTKLTLEDKINELNTKISELANAKLSLEKQLAEVKEGRSSVGTDLEKIKTDLKNQITLNENLNKKINELTDTLNVKENEKLNIAKELEELKIFQKDLESQLKELKLTKDDNEKQISQLSAKIKKLSAAYAKVKDSAAQFSDLLAKKDQGASDKKAELTNLSAGLDKAMNEKNSLLSSVKEREQELSSARNVISKLETQIKDLQKELIYSKEKELKAKETLNKAKTLLSGYKKRLMDAYVELELIRSEKKMKQVQ